MKKLSALILTVLILAATTVFSQPAQGKRFEGPMAGKLKTMLKLTPDQEKKFADLKYDQQQKAIDTRAKIEKNRLELKKILTDGKLDESKILQLTDDNSKLQGDLKNSSVRNMLAAYNILNDEQKAIFIKHLPQMLAAHKMKGNFRKGMMNRMNRGGRGMMNRSGGMMNQRGGMMNQRGGMMNQRGNNMNKPDSMKKAPLH